MIASLPMYDLPPLRAANDRFWQAIRTHLQDGPAQLTRDRGLWAQWLAPDLVLSQTCGYPYRARLYDKVTLVGTPDYGLQGCPPGHYCSIFVARAGDARTDLSAFKKARFAYNEPMSQSGWAAPLHHVRQLGFAFDDLLQTGGHRASALAVAEGEADLAAIDALTWDLLCEHEGFVTGLKEVVRTAPTPALPYICAKGRDGTVVFGAIRQAIATLSAQDRDLLHLRDLCAIPAAAYLAVPTPPAPAG